MRCLILGGGGFMGSYLADAFSQNNYSVTVFDRKFGHNLPVNYGLINYCVGEFSDSKKLQELISGVDVIVHLISATTPAESYDNPEIEFFGNLIPTVNLLKIVQESNKKIIFASSGGTVYGEAKCIPITENHSRRPLCPYGITKATIEDWFEYYGRMHGLNFTILRIANPYGLGQSLDGKLGAVTNFIWQALRNEDITIWGDGYVVRDFIYIEDLVEAFLAIIEQPINSGIYNVGVGIGYSLIEVVEMIAKEININMPKIRFLPGRAFDVHQNVLDSSKMEQDYGWTAKTSLHEGVHILSSRLAKGL
jgi:UDP-glucose 4-epimerase